MTGKRGTGITEKGDDNPCHELGEVSKDGHENLLKEYESSTRTVDSGQDFLERFINLHLCQGHQFVGL